MKVNSEAIYGTTASPFKELSFGKCTQKPGKLFLDVLNWPAEGKLLVPIGNSVKKAYFLSQPSQTLETKASEHGLQISVPASALDPVASVLALELEGTPQVLENKP